MTNDPRPPPAAAHAFVTSLDAPELDDDDAHHLHRVLRLRDGELVTIADGKGRWRTCRVVRGLLDVDGPIHTTRRLEPAITVAFAVTKGDRPEWTVQKLTELGVDRIVPVLADRSVVLWDDRRAARGVQRLRVIARSAAMQSRRTWLPCVDDAASSTEMARRFADIVLAHPGGSVASLERPAIAVGPEGGWSPAELERAVGTLDLGANTLRTETAAVAAGVLLTALRAGMVEGIPSKNA